MRSHAERGNERIWFQGLAPLANNCRPSGAFGRISHRESGLISLRAVMGQMASTWSPRRAYRRS